MICHRLAMHVTTSSQIIIRQHHLHGNNYFENFSVLFVFYYSPIFLFKINNSFHFITCVIIVVIVIVCKILIASSTSKSSCSIVLYPVSAFHNNFYKIKIVDRNSYSKKDNDKNENILRVILSLLNLLPRYSTLLKNSKLFETHYHPIQAARKYDQQELFDYSSDKQNSYHTILHVSKTKTLNVAPKCLQAQKICNEENESKSEYDNFNIQQILKKKFTAQRNQCKVKIQQPLETESCVPKVCYYVDSSINKSIQIYHTGVFTSHVSTVRNTIIRNSLKLEKNETREFLLSKGNERSLPKDKQSFIDMSKVEQHPFTTGSTVILTLRPSAFLFAIKKSCYLMKTLIRSSATQAQCARHPHRHKEVGQ